MSAARKPPPLVCFKWPWSPNPNASPSPCGDLELPWLFKSIRTVAQGLLITGDLPSPAAEGRGGGGRRRQRHPGAAVEADLGEAEQRALAAALSSGRAATVLEFYSPRCRLCASLQGLVRELEDGADGWASFVLADAEDDRWLPELLHYDIRYVPCFVLLDKHGRALAKTGVPKSRQHVIAGLHHLLNMKQPPGQEGKKGSIMHAAAGGRGERAAAAAAAKQQQQRQQAAAAGAASEQQQREQRAAAVMASKSINVWDHGERLGGAGWKCRYCKLT